LPGWRLYFALLKLGDDFNEERLAAVIEREEDTFRSRNAGQDLSSNATISHLRYLFRQAGTKPSRYRPSSEALARRVLKGNPLPRIFPLVDFNNLLSLRTLVPCCVMKTGSITPPIVLRCGQEGEQLSGLRGPFHLAGKPTLTDSVGPFGTPITDDHRVILGTDDREAVLAAYIPRDIHLQMDKVIRELAAEAGGIHVAGDIYFEPDLPHESPS